MAELRAGEKGYPVAIASAGASGSCTTSPRCSSGYREYGTHPIDADWQLRLEDIRSLPAA